VRLPALLAKKAENIFPALGSPEVKALRTSEAEVVPPVPVTVWVVRAVVGVVLTWEDERVGVASGSPPLAAVSNSLAVEGTVPVSVVLEYVPSAFLV